MRVLFKRLAHTCPSVFGAIERNISRKGVSDRIQIFWIGIEGCSEVGHIWNHGWSLVQQFQIVVQLVFYTCFQVISTMSKRNLNQDAD